MGNLDQVLKAAEALDTAEKMLLVESLWDSIRETDQPVLTAAEKQEIERRIAAYQQNPETAVSWETVQATARALLK